MYGETGQDREQTEQISGSGSERHSRGNSSNKRESRFDLRTPRTARRINFEPVDLPRKLVRGHRARLPCGFCQQTDEIIAGFAGDSWFPYSFGRVGTNGHVGLLDLDTVQRNLEPDFDSEKLNELIKIKLTQELEIKKN